MNQSIYYVFLLIILLVLANYKISQCSKDEKDLSPLDKIKTMRPGGKTFPLIKTDPCFLYENTNRLQKIYLKMVNTFKTLSLGKEYRLSGETKTTQYIPGTWDDRLRLEVRQLTNIILEKINSVTGFHFIFVYFDNIKEIVDEKGNINFIYNVYIEDPQEEFAIRVWIDVVKFIYDVPKKEEVLTCTKLTLPPFPTFEIGYPKPDQFIPLPTEVITTPGFGATSAKGINYREGKPIKYLYLNSIRIYNTNAVINADGKCIMEQTCGRYEITLDHSLYNGPHTPFQDPACLRNKWPRLPDQPKNKDTWACAIRSTDWDENGVFMPPECRTKDCPGIQNSTEPIPLRPDFWPTHVTIPRNSGPNYWIFDLSRGDSRQNRGFSDY